MKNYSRKIDYYCTLIADAKITNPEKIPFLLSKLQYFIGRQLDAIEEVIEEHNTVQTH